MKQYHIIGILGLGILNGMFSPILTLAVLFNPLWLPAFIPVGPSVLFLLSSLFVSTLTIMAAGIPAALYERVTGKSETDSTSALIWIGTLAVISVPAVERLVLGAR